jgi:hypothetical protein
MELQGQTGGQVDVTFGCESVGSCIATDSSTVMGAFALPLPPSGQSLDLTSVNVRYTSPSGFASDIGRVNTAADCWYFDHPDTPTQILACPQTCTEIQTGGASATLEVLFGCKTKLPILA